MIPPGQPYSITLSSADGEFKAKCGSTTVFPTITNLGGGSYRLDFDAGEITCPGPLRIVQTGPITTTITVGPCP